MPKDVIEERLFTLNRHLFSGLDLVFFDTTSIYLEGREEKQLASGASAKITAPI